MERVPYATVVVPTRNEQPTIRACLEAVLAQDYPRARLEILVVDGRSEDRTREIVEEVAASSGGAVRLMDNPRRTIPSALNLALAEARGDYFIRVDGHSKPVPHYVRRLVEWNEELDADQVGGWVSATAGSAFGRAVAAAISSPFSTGNPGSWRQPDAPREVASAPCGSYRVAALRAIGGFDEEQLVNEDYEANHRLRRAGGRVMIVPDVCLGYVPRDSVRRLARQFSRYGYYKARTMLKHPSSVRPRHLVPAAAIVAAAALAAAAAIDPSARALLAAAIVLYAFAILVASALAGRGLGFAAVRLPLVFATMHASWGTGNLAGLIRFLPVRGSLAVHQQPASMSGVRS
jgi:cellulose synthase/poly-beta-1,6-N-acetylglucosamine synthase-like glycosyltransferase